jgi:hypothetical protein
MSAQGFDKKVRALLIERGLLLGPSLHEHVETTHATTAHPPPAKYNNNNNRFTATRPHPETCAQEKDKLEALVRELKAEVSTLHAQLAPFTTANATAASEATSDGNMTLSTHANTTSPDFSSPQKAKELV